MLPRCFPKTLAALAKAWRNLVKSPSLRQWWAPALNHPAKKSTTPVSRLYIAPAIFIAPFDSISASTGCPCECRLS